MREEVLRLSEVTYEEQGVVQLQDFCLSVFAGEIVGVLHRSGHGISALIDLLRFNLPLQAGSVYYREERVNSWRAPARHDNRIGVIKSQCSLVEDLTVADNIFVLRPGFRSWLVRPRVLVGQVQPVLDSLGMDIRADALVSTLSPFERVVVELVKAVVAGCRLIILREIGTIISDVELERLHAAERVLFAAPDRLFAAALAFHFFLELAHVVFGVSDQMLLADRPRGRGVQRSGADGRGGEEQQRFPFHVHSL